MVAAFSVAPAQERPRVRLNVSDAIDFALGHHPSLRSRSAIEEGTAARVSEARSAYFPRLDVSGQENRATGNVVSGSLFSMPGIPQVMGPPTGRQFDSGVWGSAAGFGTSFNIAGLAREMALVDAAMAERERTRAGTEVQRLAVGFGAADDFITAVAASETVKAHEANVTRAEVLARIVHAEVANQLRPGAEESRANAEHALAATGLIRAEQARALSRAELAQALGIAGEPVELIAEPLLTLPSNAPSVDGVPPNHPLLAQADSETAAARARKRAAALEYLPRVDLAAALWVRGSGLFPGGLNLGDEQGLVPDTPNWAGGIVLSWPLMDIFAIRARERVEAANVKLSLSQTDETMQAIQSQIDSARAILDGARRVAENTPIALEAARMAERQATARYQSGLAGVVEAAEAQRLLVQAEIDDAVARLAVWRALLLLARATGDLTPFLAQLSQSQGP